MPMNIIPGIRGDKINEGFVGFLKFPAPIAISQRINVTCNNTHMATYIISYITATYKNMYNHHI